MDFLLLPWSSVVETFIVLGNWWWLWLPVVLAILAYELMQHHSHIAYFSALEWVLIEIRVPQEAHKSLKAMEQIFSALHSLPQLPPAKNLGEAYRNWKLRFFGGKIPDYLTLEIVSVGGEIHFYVRTLKNYRGLVESQIYAHYPDSELTQASDHVAQLPTMLPTADVDLMGAELGLVKSDAFPIKTYPEFEEEHAGRDDVRRIDPLAPLAEVLGSLTLGEYLGIQINVRPTGDKWIKNAQKELDKLFERPEKAQDYVMDKVLGSIESGVAGALDTLTGTEAAKKEEKKEEKKEGKKFMELSYGTQETIKAMERSFGKLAFETGIRLLYAAPKDRFNQGNFWSANAAFKQFSTQALNGFKPAFMPTVLRGWHKEQKTVHNKMLLFGRYRIREFPEKPFVLNTEELTTIYHFPDIGVKTPTLPRVEAKKGEAPSGIPTV